MRDILLVLILIPLVPACFFRPWIGILGWLWVAYFSPHGMTWGFGRSIPVAMLIGGATLVGLLFTPAERKPLPRAPAVYLLFAFILDYTFTTILALNPDLAWGKWEWVTKSLLMCFVAMTLFQDRVRLRYMYMVTALSLGFFGVRGFFWVVRTGGGGGWVMGPDLSFFSDNNELGLALCMILPVLIYLSREEPRPWLKLAFRLIFGMTLVSIFFTYSRGAYLGAAVVVGILVWRSPWRLRFAVTVVVAALIAAPLLPERLWNRIGSIEQQESAETRDDSAKGRIQAWTTAWNLAADRPFTGGGFRALHNPFVWDRYYGDFFLKVRDTHSLYFEVLSEHGFLGLGIYLAIVISMLLTLRRIRKRWRKHPEHGYLSHYAEMTQLCIYPYLVAGAFLTVAYFDIYLYLIASSMVLHALSAKAEETVRVAVPAQTQPARAIPVRRRTVPAVAPRPQLRRRRV
jgi:probable O-glycosylation ligase (exosortase A-associated)